MKKIFFPLLFLILMTLKVYPQTYEAPNQKFVPDNIVKRPPKILLDNTSSIAVVHYQQCGQSWSSDILGTCTSTICTEGCALTCAAMLLRTNNVIVYPGQLNNWLTQNNGYYDGCNIYWDIAATYPGCTLTWYGEVNYDLSLIKAEIDGGNPVIINVILSGGYNHFVVIKDYQGSGTSTADFIVLDPNYTYETILSSYTIANNPSLRLFHNVSQSMQIILGLEPLTELDFGNVQVGQSKTLNFIVTNQSLSEANLLLSPSSPNSPFQLNNGSTLNLQPGHSFTFTLIFTPNFAQSYSQNWTLTHNATNWSSPWQILLKGKGTTNGLLNPPNLVSPVGGQIINIGSNSGQVIMQWLNIVGATGYELDIDGIRIIINSGNQTSYTATLNQGDHQWRARTKNSDSQYGVWSSYQNFSLNLAQIVIGLNPDYELDFGNVQIGQTKSLIFTVTNQSTSNSNLALSSSAPETPFQLKNGATLYLTPGDNYSFTLNFTPENIQSYSQNWILTHNATNWSSPWTIHLKGTGTSGEVPPTVNTNSVSNIGASSVTLNGLVNPNGLETNAWFEYSQGSGLVNPSSTSPQSVGSAIVSSQISQIAEGLDPSVQYYYRIVANNSEGTSYGSILDFYTTSYGAPIAQTDPATNVSGTSAYLHGTINANGGDTDFMYEWGTSISYGSQTIWYTGPCCMDTKSNFYVLTDLNSGTTYHYRIVARNSSGSTLGNDMIFTTLPLPIVTTFAATEVTSSSAILNGLVNPNGQETIVWFQRGVFPYNQGSTSQVSVGSGSVPINFSAQLENLDANTAYHFRILASTSAGVSFGDDVTFTTQIFTPMLTICGYVNSPDGNGLQDIMLSGLPGNPFTDLNGFYFSEVISGWSGTVTPEKIGYLFEPTTKVYSNITSNQTTNYIVTPQTLIISGYVNTSDSNGINNVTLSGLPNNPITDIFGNYNTSVEYGWSGIVTPLKDNYFFSPGNHVYYNVTTNQNTNYTGTLPTEIYADFHNIPINYMIYQNYPNPFNPYTTIKYSIPEKCFVSIIIYDVFGREIKKIVNTQVARGFHEVIFTATDLASGIYYYRIQAEEYSEVKKMLYLK